MYLIVSTPPSMELACYFGTNDLSKPPFISSMNIFIPILNNKTICFPFLINLIKTCTKRGKKKKKKRKKKKKKKKHR